MGGDKLLKTMPILQNQVDALLEFDCTATVSEMMDSFEDSADNFPPGSQQRGHQRLLHAALQRSDPTVRVLQWWHHKSLGKVFRDGKETDKGCIRPVQKVSHSDGQSCRVSQSSRGINILFILSNTIYNHNKSVPPVQKFGIDKAEIPDLARVSRNQNKTFIFFWASVLFWFLTLFWFVLFCRA